MSDDTATVSLNLDGGFDSSAARNIAATEALGSAFDTLTAAANAYKDPRIAEAAKYSAITAELQRQASIEAQIAGFDGNRVRALAQQEALLKRMRDDATGATAKRAEEDAKAKAKEDARSRDGASFGVDMMVAQALEHAGERLLQAGVELAKSAAELIIAGDKLAIAESSKKEVQSAVLGKMGGDYEGTVKAALDLGISPDEAVAESKKLLNAKFKSTEIPVLMRIKAGMDIAGQDGDALFKSLEKIQLEPKVKVKDLEGLWKLGIDSKEVYKRLAAEMGTSVPAAMAKVKAGTADSAKVIEAIEETAGKKFGGFADAMASSPEALAANIAGRFKMMFDGIDLAPVKEVLNNVLGVIEGPGGKAMKGAITELFDSLNHAFLDDFRGDEGRARLEAFAQGAAAAIHEFAEGVQEAAPAIRLLEHLAEASALQLPEWIRTAGEMSGLTELIAQLNTLETILEQLGIVGHAVKPTDMDPRALDRPSGMDAVPGDAGTDSADTGNALDTGMAEGIEGGKAAAINAAAQMGRDAVQAARDAVGYGSPATEFIDTGDMSAEGMAIGMRSSPAPGAAGRKMAADALGGAQGAVGGAAAVGASSGAGGGAAAGGDVTVNLNITGSGAPGKDLIAALPQLEALLRRVQRDQREGASP